MSFVSFTISLFQNQKTMSKDAKQRILEGASSLFIKEGIKSITMDEIAEHLGMSKRTIYEHFDDKKTLVYECLKYMDSLIDQKYGEIKGGSNNIMEQLMMVFRASENDIKNVNPKFFEDLRLVSTETDDYFHEKQKIRLQRRKEELEQGIAEGVIRPDLDTTIMSVMFDSEMSIMFKKVMEQMKADNAFLKVHHVMVLTFIRGIATPKGMEIIDKFTTEEKQKD